MMETNLKVECGDLYRGLDKGTDKLIKKPIRLVSGQ
jgi:hypothetical protein